MWFGVQLLWVTLVFGVYAKRPDFLECVSSDECGVGEYCKLGLHRYSIPTCMPYSEVGDPCRPWDSGPFNTTVSYPDGTEVDLKEIHSQFCPCSPGLVCSMISMTCYQPDTFDNELIPRL